MKRYARGALVIPLFSKVPVSSKDRELITWASVLRARNQRVFKEKNWFKGDVSASFKLARASSIPVLLSFRFLNYLAC